MPNDKLTATTTVPATQSETWHYYTEAEHVINWNFASEDWHCPRAVNDLREGGEFEITMAAKDGKMTFELEGTYDEVQPENHIAYTLSNGQQVEVDFSEEGEETTVTVTFDPAEGNGPHHQADGWQAILDNFRKYVTQMEDAEA